MDEMDKIFKELSKTIPRMELDQGKSDLFLRNQFIRNPNPQMQQI
jgi:hypothetical protein